MNLEAGVLHKNHKEEEEKTLETSSSEYTTVEAEVASSHENRADGEEVLWLWACSHRDHL